MRARVLRARNAVRLVRNRRRPDPPTPVGMVEHVSRRLVIGWVSAPPQSAPTRVTLMADDMALASTYATSAPSMSGVHSAVRGGGAGGRARPDNARDPRRPWQGRLMPGPEDDRRNSQDQIRVFSFRVRGIWPFLRRRNRLTVQVDGHPLPIFRHGMWVQPPSRGKRSLDELRDLYEQGYLLSQGGQVRLSRTLDVQWQQAVMALHRRVHRVVADQFGYETFAIYGTLLGAVREAGPIGHDPDFDSAYLSDHHDGRSAAEELVEIAQALVRADLEVKCVATALHISDPERPGERIDLFHCYFDEDGAIAFPFGVAGTTPFTRDDWSGLKASPFLDDEILVPVAAEKLVAHLYGDDWRRPKPGFNWAIDRTHWSPEGRLTAEQRTRVHWANFYHHHQFAQGSPFFDFARSLPDLPRHILDIGCGDGRDSRAFAAAGHEVLGLDASDEGVKRAREAAQVAELGERTRFEVCDVSDDLTLRRHLMSVTAETTDPVAFYLRFFLHAIPTDAQETLLQQLSACARPGDLLLAEFRTLGDEGQPKAHGQHYRRFQDPRVLRDDLVARFGFAVEHFEESRGLSPFGDEDPLLCRVVARRADVSDS